MLKINYFNTLNIVSFPYCITSKLLLLLLRFLEEAWVEASSISTSYLKFFCKDFRSLSSILIIVVDRFLALLGWLKLSLSLSELLLYQKY